LSYGGRSRRNARHFSCQPASPLTNIQALTFTYEEEWYERRAGASESNQRISISTFCILELNRRKPDSSIGENPMNKILGNLKQLIIDDLLLIIGII
jgi:hypothetical protein